MRLKITIITARTFSVLCALLLSINLSMVSAQVKISESNTAVDSSAMLELESTTKGFLPPRMTSNQRDSIENPTSGLMIYCTDCLELQLYNDTAWTNIMGLPTNDPWQCGDLLNYEGQDYTTVLIGNQCWMAENLNVGTMISGSTNMSDNSILEKYCYDDNPNNCITYGALYQWDEIMDYQNTEGVQGVCPTGFHLPTDDEWKTLEIHLGMSQSEADAFGNRGTDQGSQLAGDEPLWLDGTLDQNAAFNLSGFAALPVGKRYSSGLTSNLSLEAYFWSSSVIGSQIWHRRLGYEFAKVFRFPEDTSEGYSVRCVQD